MHMTFRRYTHPTNAFSRNQITIGYEKRFPFLGKRSELEYELRVYSVCAWKTINNWLSGYNNLSPTCTTGT